MTMVFFRDVSPERAPSSVASAWTSRSAWRGRRDHEPQRRLPFGLLHEWWRRRHSRASLSRLDARMLKDIGLSYAEAEHEANKPFWLL
jgi:uncharacterized protein YjiS (DUF1127 family)